MIQPTLTALAAGLGVWLAVEAAAVVVAVARRARDHKTICESERPPAPPSPHLNGGRP